MLTTWKKLGAKAMYLFNIPRVGEELAIDGLELVGAWFEHLCDDVWSSPWQRPQGGVRMHVPCHEATDGPGVPVASCSPKEMLVGAFWVRYTGESGSLPTSCVVSLVEERKVT
jgi:hypothetical protein